MDKEKEITKTVTDQDTSEKNTTGTKEDSIRRDYGFAADVELKECRYCRVMIPKKAKVCPNCRMSLKRHWFRNLAAVVFAAAVIGAGGYYLSDHWGIMRDAVMSVWMAQDNTAVPTVSVTTVDTAEMAAGAAQAGTSEVAVNKETGEKTDAEETMKSNTEAARDNITGTEKKADSPDTAADIDALKEDKAEEEKSTSPGAGSAEEKNAAGSDANMESAGKDNNGNDSAGKDNNDNDSADQDSNDNDSAGKDNIDNDKVGKDSNNKGNVDKDNIDNDSAGKDNKNNDNAGKDNNGNNSGDKNNNSKIEDRGEESRQASGETAAAGNDSTQQEQAFRDDCTEVGYKALLRDSETYLNKALKVEVQVVCQVMGGLFDENIYYLCKAEGASGIERYYIIRDDREEEDILILEGDTLTVYGELFGSCKLPAGLIETRPTVPAVSMRYFDLAEE